MNWKVVFALLFVFVTLVYRAGSSNSKGRRFRVIFFYYLQAVQWLLNMFTSDLILNIKKDEQFQTWQSAVFASWKDHYFVMIGKS